MRYDNLIVEDSQSAVIIRLNRPSRLNALNVKTLQELECAVMTANNSAKFSSIIITGTGRSFAAGADISEFTDLNEQSAVELSQLGQRVFNTIEDSGKLIIAAVNGFALGGGCELAMACHLRYASMNAKFAQPEINLGTIAGFGATVRLVRLIGRSKALKLMLTGSPIGADEALRTGLIDELTDEDNLIHACMSFIETIANKAPLSTKAIIKCVNAYDENVKQGLELETSEFAKLCATADFKEGTAAFLEKRIPIFKGS
ncbi:enoyl-CoA hydratase/isomerase [Candidatus Magnetoovum chiemensis]|nr:enoyl-CoA hydratase/isomerase [Candidatus Magnetoovum chiemensis]